MKIKPIPGRLVTDPARGHAPLTKIIEVKPTPYWMQRVAHGDVELVKPSQAAPVAQDKKGK